jgi:Holliday junction resolvasome RuvABC endonuclease subunit
MTKPNKKRVILALDVSSSSTGYAVLRSGRWNKSGASFGTIKTPSSLPLGKRLVLFRDEVKSLLESVKPTMVVIEDVFSGRNVSTMKLLARFNGVAVEVSRRYLKEEPVIALTTKVRSFLECGKKKEDAFAYICSRYNLDWSFSKMNDVADALCLALYVYGVKEK